ncbi:kelch repeat protein [Anaeramoeba ignava]|uniref:Kelch repeat protein n=1 Tax=Anaeramoeba ignava TaxID=1746090 RepID=A0A9Q0LJA6_ANAIG|nr:kelch repeat protein [Anaeramoeba ignava]
MIFSCDQVETEGERIRDNCKLGFVKVNDEEIYAICGSSGFEIINSVYSINVKQNTWKYIETTDDIPTPRSGISATYYKGKIYMFGGFNRIQHNQKGRHSHSIARCEDKLYLFGGRLDHSISRSNDLWKYSIKKNKWKEMNNFIGEKPSKRSSHIGHIIDRTLYIFGGVDNQDIVVNDMYQYSIDSKTWSKIFFRDSIVPSPRSSPSSTVFGSSIILFGGQYAQDGIRLDFNDIFQFDSVTQKWKQLKSYSNNSEIPKRSCHVCETVGSKVFIYGGEVYNDNKRYAHLNDIWAIDFTSDLVKDLRKMEKKGFLVDF